MVMEGAEQGEGPVVRVDLGVLVEVVLAAMEEVVLARVGVQGMVVLQMVLP